MSLAILSIDKTYYEYNKYCETFVDNATGALLYVLCKET